jgi:small nuclear ribonucleoprotein (snRNP)-like protein
MRNEMLTREMRKSRLASESKEDNEGEKAKMAKGEDKLNKKQEMPVKLLQEAEGHVVTMELKNGDIYCGNLVESEDNWNCQLESVTATTKVLLNCISLVIFLKPASLCHV